MKDALAVALVHFLWQGALLAIMGGVLMRLAKAPTVRYAIGVATMMAMLASPAVTVFMVRTPVPIPVSVTSVVPADVPSGIPSRPGAADAIQPVEQVVARGSVAPALPTSWILGLWAIGVFLLSLRFAGGLALANRMATAAVIPVGADLQRRAADLAVRLGMRVRVRVCSSALVAVPVMVGWLRPVVVLPPAALVSLPLGQLEALLAHEFAHIRRYDYLVNLLQTLVETLCFYHPAVWWMSHQVRLVREECCDDVAVSVCDRLTYVTALSSLAALSPQLALAASGGSLRDRVRRLVEPSPSSVSAKGGWMAMLPMLLVLSFAAPHAWSTSAADQTVTAKPVVVAQVRPVVVEQVTPVVVQAEPVMVVVKPRVGEKVDVRPVTVKAVPLADGKVRVVMPKVGSDATLAVTTPVKIVGAQTAIARTDARPMVVRAAPVSVDTNAVVTLPKVAVGQTTDLQAREERAAQERRIVEQERRIRETEAQLEALELRLRDARTALERQRELFDKGLVTQQTFEDAKTKLAELQEQLERARVGIGERQAVEVERRATDARRAEELIARGLAAREERAATEQARQEELVARGLALREDRERVLAEVEQRAAAIKEEAVRRRVDESVMRREVSPDTQVQAGDRLTIMVAGEPDLPTGFTVRSDGSIRFPFLGVIRVQGSTASQVQTVIQKLIAEKKLATSPRVTVSIARVVRRTP